MQSAKPRNRLWLWFFGLLAVLSVIAVTVLIRFNLGQQLKHEELRAARKLWDAKGPQDYRLVYTVKLGDAEPETRVVHVRGGATVFVTVNGRKLDEKQHGLYGMDALLDEIERFLDIDSEEGKPRTFLRAHFDPKDGHLISFVRRVMGGRERVEINVLEMEALPPAKGPRR